MKGQREVTGVLGKTGQGKSVWTRTYAKNHSRLFVFDPLADTDVEYQTDEQLIKLLEDGGFQNGKHFRVGTVHADSLHILASISFLSGNNLLCVEECAIAFDSPRASLDSWWRELILLGRHRDVSLLFTAQRPVSVPIIARSQFTRLVSFAQHEGADVDWLYDYFGDQTEEIPHLQPLECLDCYHGIISRYSIPYDHPKNQNLDLNQNQDQNSIKRPLPWLE